MRASSAQKSDARRQNRKRERQRPRAWARQRPRRPTPTIARENFTVKKAPIATHSTTRLLPFHSAIPVAVMATNCHAHLSFPTISMLTAGTEPQNLISRTATDWMFHCCLLPCSFLYSVSLSLALYPYRCLSVSCIYCIALIWLDNSKSGDGFCTKENRKVPFLPRDGSYL